MNRELLIEIGSANSQINFRTLDLLNEYYKKEGYNMFKAAELAENNIQNFVTYARNDINQSLSDNTCSLFNSANASIVSFNSNFEIVNSIYKSLKHISWQDFEHFCGYLLKKCFNAIKVEVSQQSNDGGVDFSGIMPFKSNCSSNTYGKIDLYGQAKKYSGNVGRVDIDKFTAFANRQKRDNQYPAQLFLFCTTSGYNNSAMNEIRKNNFIALNGQQIAYLIFQYLNPKVESTDNYIELFMSEV